MNERASDDLLKGRTGENVEEIEGEWEGGVGDRFRRNSRRTPER